MTILRNPNRERYTVIDNTALEDRELSFDAIGVYAYLLSKPDGWKIIPTEIEKRGKMSRHKRRRIFDELKRAGYLKTRRPRGPNGEVKGQELVLVESPANEANGDLFDREAENLTLGDDREAGFPTVGKHRGSGNRPLVNTDRTTANPDSAPAARNPKRDTLWEALLGACGISWKDANPTKSERGAWNKALAEIKATGADADEIYRRARRYRKEWPNVSITPSALARRWTECAAESRELRDKKPAPQRDPMQDQLSNANRTAKYLGLTRNDGESDQDWIARVDTEFQNVGRKRA